MDKFPVGVMMNKRLTVRTAQQHGQKYVPKLLENTGKGELDASSLATHWISLEQSVRGYDMLKNKAENCRLVVFAPQITSVGVRTGGRQAVRD
jgi:threonine dehydrogenase-like Zn-dependent dehydrogenase